MGCCDTIELCSFPHGRDRMVVIAMIGSCLALICTVLTLDILTVPFGLVVVGLVTATSYTTLSPTSLLSAALLSFIVAGYLSRDIWQLVEYLGGDCIAFEQYLANTTAAALANLTTTTTNATLLLQDGTTDGEDSVQQEMDEEMTYICNDRIAVAALALAAAFLWCVTGICVLNIKQPGNYESLVDIVSRAGTYARLVRGCCTKFACCSFPHGKDRTTIAALILSVVACVSSALLMTDANTLVLSILATTLILSTTYTTLVPAALILAALMGLVLTGYAFMGVYFVYTICASEEAYAKQHASTDETPSPVCLEEQYAFMVQLVVGLMWLVTSALVFMIPQPAESKWNLEQVGVDTTLDISDDEADQIELQSGQLHAELS